MALMNDIGGILRTFPIGKGLSVSGSNIDLALRASDNIPALAALVSGTAPFPASTNTIATITFEASTGAVVPIGGPSDTVRFSARDSAGFTMRLYPDAPSASKAAGPCAELACSNGERFLILDLCYDASVNSKGSVAFAAGATAIFDASAKRQRSWRVIHRFGAIPAAQAVEQTIAAWTLPRLIETPADLPPASWIVTQVEGSLSLSLGADAGFDFSWIRELPGAQLIGDLGLKIKAASAQLSASVGGACTLVIGRESDAPVLRLSIFKNDTESLGFNASLGVSSIGDTRPGDLAAAIFGIHPTQLIEDLRHIAPGFKAFFALWDKLGAKAGDTLLSLIASRQPAELDRLKSILDEISAVATNPLKITKLLEREISNPAFFATPFGQLLSSQVQGLAQSLQDLNLVRRIGDFACSARDLLKGDIPPLLVQSLNKLPALGELDNLIKAKLAALLGKTPDRYTASDHKAVQSAFAKVVDNSAAFASAGVAAARKNLEAKFVACLQTTDSDTALIDVEFDFAANPALLPVLRRAIDGDFIRLLGESIPGVRLRKGMLTHGVERQVHTQLNLPFYDRQSTQLLSSLARMTVSCDNGRLFVYDLNAFDDWKTQAKSNFVRDSKLSVAASFADRIPGVRVFSPPTGAIGYSLTAGVLGLQAAALDRYFAPVGREYFPDLHHRSMVWPSDGAIGDSRISLDIELPASVLTEWFAAPPDPRDPVYFRFSRLLQGRLKSLITALYFGDSSRYGTLGVAGPMLVWAAIPPMNSFDGHDILWDASDLASYQRAVSDLRTRENLRDLCAAISPLLTGNPKTRGVAQFYEVDDPGAAPMTLSNFLSSALSRPSPSCRVPVLLGALVAFEQKVVRAAVAAAVEAARFTQDASSNPSEAIRHLSKFGEQVVDTFHANLRGAVAVPGNLLVPLGTGLFAEASRALGIARTGDDSGVTPAALFSLTVLKPGVNITAEQLRTGQFKLDSVAAERRVAS
ncbi:MAG: hypothetical protein JSU00_13865 [Acidobacteria bacterium]|nr:hypothetical protein [Acidobacteriota bacterium]